MAARVHLIRHGEVHNPDHLVYASLDGFTLSDRGQAQARDMARYLGRAPIVAIWSSPLERAVRTAEPLATRTGLPIRIEPDLIEWRLMDRWAGHRWEALGEAFPGELEAYLETPHRLDFSPEPLTDLAARVGGVVKSLAESHPHGDVAVVSHSTPVRVATLALTGSALEHYWDREPGHASVTTLRLGGRVWEVETEWEPT